MNTCEPLWRMQNWENNTALHTLRNGRKKMALFLLNLDPELASSVNRAGESPLYLAIEARLYGVLRKIVNQNSFNLDNPFSRNWLHAAIFSRSVGSSKSIDNGNGKITQLPKDLRILIISILPLIDAVRLCSLSRQWLPLWIYSRRLKFDENRFIDPASSLRLMHGGHELAKEAWRAKSRGRRRFLEYVNTTLPRFVQPDLFKLSIRVCYEPGYDQYLQDWLRLAIAKDVQEIKLDFSVEELLQSPSPLLFEVLDFLHEGKSLQLLSLNFCQLTTSFSFKNFAALTSLSLSKSFFPTDLAQNLETNFPLPKDLSLVDCTYLED
ncbi:hypothetical protein HHK36_032800 [Tetracentron sinense]|uniref:At1g61320/AtMIF1 LRR domain-containing protein n=1 Tax=Tetracentron sinense TaxID=13715 RepID=A0A835CX92_TETSI|nr:hypothetical protein HHK36_032800 [Tetracentron sinense]